MKILKVILIVVGIVLIAVGLYNAFVPQELVDVGPLEVSAKKGLNNQTLGMIGLGVLALIAGTFIKQRG
jgi:Na+-transporting methylmalonyl-CoA/oxaloacetate decarboxylase beta subunit|tara:strand:+ start:91338 stop:91544 length:207 start_codon:yes stop_codon:yes gene_type:complete